MIDGWIDAIADAVEDDEATGPAFDPFNHKLVRRTMTDYLDEIAAAKADIARLKGEKEAFEQSNAPDDADEEELEHWNYAKDLDRQIRELKSENKDTLKTLTKLEKAATRNPSPPERGVGMRADAALMYDQAKAALKPVLDQFAQIDAALEPYEKIKTELTAARARYRELTNAFVTVLADRCVALSDDENREMVLELFAEDVRAALDTALAVKRQELVRYIEGLWDKYRMTLTSLRSERTGVEDRLNKMLSVLSYS